MSQSLGRPLSREEVLTYLPHRDPFLMVDRVLEYQAGPDGPDNPIGTRIVAIKEVRADEPHFAGHFPKYPIMPGVLVIEALAQTACFSLLPGVDGDIARVSGKFEVALVGVDNARFRRPVLPGDTLRLESVVKRVRGRMWSFHVEAKVSGELAVEADLLAALALKI